MSQLVLSLFPGLGLLDMAFEREGFCVVRGPDCLWGGDIRLFDPPAGKFDGVIGGPPCQCFSQLMHLLRAAGKGTKQINLVPQFVRCVEEAAPEWFLMENVKQAQSPQPAGYTTLWYDLIDSDVGGETKRFRRFWFGTRDGRELAIRRAPRSTIFPPERAVTRNVRRPSARHFARARARGRGVLPGDGEYASIEEICELQGIPTNFARGIPFKREQLRVMLGNGVPFPMGRAIARAVKEATASRSSNP